MGEAARQTALEFPWDRPVERTLEIYRNVIGAQERAESHTAGVQK
jgi:hypothetical protein